MLFLIFTCSSQAIEQQIATNWCWASSIQDVLLQAGIYQSQDYIAQRLTGWPENRPAYINEVVWLINSYGLKARAIHRPASPKELYRTLSSGWKIIAFVRPLNGPVGHFIVLEGISPNRNIIVGDPTTGFTFEETLLNLYNGWNWGGSVVVGK